MIAIAIQDQITWAVARSMTAGEYDRYADDVERLAETTEIQYGKLWDCCAAKPAKVAVFSNGARHAVCKGCASMYTGEIQDLPVADLPRVTEPITLLPGYLTSATAIYTREVYGVAFCGGPYCQTAMHVDMVADHIDYSETHNR